MNFDVAFDRLIGHEGGFVDDPKDPGGETKFGISKRAYPKLDIRNLTIDQARAIYRTDYWNRVMADQYDGAIGFQLFDIGVNSGIGTAARLLQRAVGATEDGVVGAQTVAKVRAMPVAKVLMRLNAERLEYLTNIGGWGPFSRGWARRVAGNLRYAAGDI
jgi:lysozyme family protein